MKEIAKARWYEFKGPCVNLTIFQGFPIRLFGVSRLNLRQFLGYIKGSVVSLFSVKPNTHCTMILNLLWRKSRTFFTPLQDWVSGGRNSEVHRQFSAFTCNVWNVLTAHSRLDSRCGLKAKTVSHLIFNEKNLERVNLAFWCAYQLPSSDTSWNDVTDLPFSFSSHNCDQTDKDIAMGPTASKNFIFLLSLLIFSNF